MSLPIYHLEISSEIISPWYNQPKKNNFITFTVRLLDINDQLVTNQNISIKVILLYQEGRLVDKNILTNSGNTVISRDGTALIKVRIEDVSSVHQGKLFILRIIPNTQSETLNNKIAYVDSTPIKVMSKPPKDMKDSPQQQQQMNQNLLKSIKDEISNSNLVLYNNNNLNNSNLTNSSPNKRTRYDPILPLSYDPSLPQQVFVPLTMLHEIIAFNTELQNTLQR